MRKLYEIQNSVFLDNVFIEPSHARFLRSCVRLPSCSKDRVATEPAWRAKPVLVEKMFRHPLV